jgi:hypothetical protein
MQRLDLHLKLELELDDRDNAAKLANEICRQLLKQYGVRRAEVSTILEKD